MLTKNYLIKPLLGPTSLAHFYLISMKPTSDNLKGNNPYKRGLAIISSGALQNAIDELLNHVAKLDVDVQINQLKALNSKFKLESEDMAGFNI